jgi:hypothetical protein
MDTARRCRADATNDEAEEERCTLLHIHAALDLDAFAVAREAGKEMALSDAVALATC